MVSTVEYTAQSIMSLKGHYANPQEDGHTRLQCKPCVSCSAHHRLAMTLNFLSSFSYTNDQRIERLLNAAITVLPETTAFIVSSLSAFAIRIASFFMH